MEDKSKCDQGTVGKGIAQEGFRQAEKELKEKQVKEIKEIVLKTLERIKEQEKVKKEAEERLKFLQLDLDDLKEGRLDRIEERQKKDSKARGISVVTMERLNDHEDCSFGTSRWYTPYRWQWNPYPVVHVPSVFGITDVVHANEVPLATYGTITTTANQYQAFLNCSVAKDATAGAYCVSGEVVHVR